MAGGSPPCATTTPTRSVSGRWRRPVATRRGGSRRAHERRPLARHVEQAKLGLKDTRRQALFRCHLKWLGAAELPAAPEFATRGALYARDGQWDRATADFTRATQLAPDDEAVWYE